MSSAPLHSGDVAAAAGVNVETLRYYERRGLLRAPRRGRSGYREFAPEAIEIVRFVKRAQSLGFTLDEIQELLALRRPRAGQCGVVHAAAVAKLAEIETKLRALDAMRGAIEKLVAACRADTEPLRCPLIEMLAGASEENP